MRWLRTVASEALGLFVDDVGYAISILAWLFAAWVLLPRLDLPPSAKGAILFVGLAAILIESAARRARR